MKISKSILASVVVAGALVAGSASAMTTTAIDLNSITSSTNLNVSVKDGVATLFGTVDSQFERIQAAKVAANIDGVEQVRNLLTFSQ